MEYLVYQKSDGYVVNTIIWDSFSPINIYPDYDIVLIPDNETPRPGIGWRYFDEHFIAPRPYPSWTLDDNYEWQSPIPYPNDEYFYEWDESNQNWILPEIIE